MTLDDIKDICSGIALAAFIGAVGCWSFILEAL